MELGYAAVEVAAARRRNPGGTFTLGDQLFGDQSRTDRWMAQEINSLASKRPVDWLATSEGIDEVLNLLNRIVHGMPG